KEEEKKKEENGINFIHHKLDYIKKYLENNMDNINNTLHSIYEIIHGINLNINKLLEENGNNIFVYDNKNILEENIKKLNIDILTNVNILNNSNNEMKEII